MIYHKLATGINGLNFESRIRFSKNWFDIWSVRFTEGQAGKGVAYLSADVKRRQKL